MIDAEKHYDQRMKVFAKETVEPGGIVFLGSSHLEWFDTGRFLPGYRIVNRGIASDRLGISASTERSVGMGGRARAIGERPGDLNRAHVVGDRGVLHRLDISVFDCHPSFVLFQNGINDLGELARQGEPPLDVILACYEEVVTTMRNRLGDVPICLVNEMPTTGRFANCVPFVEPLNAHIKHVAEKHGCLHVDLHCDVVNDRGELRSELTYDGLHLNEQGYRIFANRLDGVLPAES